VTGAQVGHGETKIYRKRIKTTGLFLQARYQTLILQNGLLSSFDTCLQAEADMHASQLMYRKLILSFEKS